LNLELRNTGKSQWHRHPKKERKLRLEIPEAPPARDPQTASHFLFQPFLNSTFKNPGRKSREGNPVRSSVPEFQIIF
jgi:hypothetical protein